MTFMPISQDISVQTFTLFFVGIHNSYPQALLSNCYKNTAC
jgi:hypothetical protein